MKKSLPLFCSVHAFHFKDMVEILAKKMDLDRDGIISFEDYRKSCLADPALLEVLGACLPTRLAVYSFLRFLTSNVGKL